MNLNHVKLKLLSLGAVLFRKISFNDLVFLWFYLDYIEAYNDKQYWRFTGR